MVSQQYLKDYAEKIYRHVEGYSFDKVIRLFPRLYIQIKYYYDRIKSNEFINQLRTIQIYGYLEGIKRFQELVNRDITAANLSVFQLKKREELIDAMPEGKEKELLYTDFYYDAIEHIKKENVMNLNLLTSYQQMLQDLSSFGVPEFSKLSIKIADRISYINDRIKYNNDFIAYLEENFNI